MDYFTFDTHTQHMRLCSNNVYLICVIVYVQMWCVCLIYLLIKPKIFFEYFICFWKWFCTFMFLVFVQHASLCFSSKTGSEAVSWEACDLELPTKSAWGKSKVIFFIQKLSLLPHGYFTTILFSRNGFEAKIDVFSKSHRNFRDCLAPNSWLTASRESICASMALLASVSRLIRYYLTRKKRVFSV